ncbi:MAG: hypothetical protein R3F61_34325 [Myxococcota bacterium]
MSVQVLEADNPDGRAPLEPGDLDAFPPETVDRLQLSIRMFRMYGRCWLSARFLAIDEVAALLELGGPALGLHLSQLARGPDLEAWLAWPGMREVRHLSFHSAFLGGAGAEKVLAADLGDLDTLDLSVCDIGTKGVRALQKHDGFPSLTALYLHASTGDRTKWNEKLVADLLLDTPKKPQGASLRGVRRLGLMFWNLTRCMPALEASPLIQGLEELWIYDTIWAPPRRVSNVAALPEGVRSRTVVGWERTPVG